MQLPQSAIGQWLKCHNRLSVIFQSFIIMFTMVSLLEVHSPAIRLHSWFTCQIIQLFLPFRFAGSLQFLQSNFKIHLKNCCSGRTRCQDQFALLLICFEALCFIFGEMIATDRIPNKIHFSSNQGVKSSRFSCPNWG
jgi:hypothetical protein